MTRRGATRRAHKRPNVRDAPPTYQRGMPEMTPYEAVYHARRCVGKTAFHTRQAARKRARELRRETGRRYRVYRCPLCSRWHLTTKPWKGA